MEFTRCYLEKLFELWTEIIMDYQDGEHLIMIDSILNQKHNLTLSINIMPSENEEVYEIDVN